MEKEIVRQRMEEFFETGNNGNGLTKKFKESLISKVFEVVYDAVKEVQESIPIGNALPEADARFSNNFVDDVGNEFYYVVFKQVRSQVKGRLQLQFGWQFTTLFGKVREIQIRSDHGVVYNINGDWVLKDLVFENKEEALLKCKILNSGTLASTGLESNQPIVSEVENDEVFEDEKSSDLEDLGGEEANSETESDQGSEEQLGDGAEEAVVDSGTESNG